MERIITFVQACINIKGDLSCIHSGLLSVNDDFYFLNILDQLSKGTCEFFLHPLLIQRIDQLVNVTLSQVVEQFMD